MSEVSLEGRVMALDYGEKRIGVALSDPFNSFAMPDEAFQNTPEIFKHIASKVSEKGVSHIVVGLPLHMNGSDTEQTRRTRMFADALKEKGFSVSFWDERLSSKAAETSMLMADASRKTRKANIDSQSAAFVLQGFLDRKSHRSHHPGAPL